MWLLSGNKLFIVFIFWKICSASNTSPSNLGVDLNPSMRSSIESYGVTWYFDTLYKTGQFINGDWWVVGPVKIIKIEPQSINHRNGSMINPYVEISGETKQGYDGRITLGGGYDSSKNVTLGISESKPLEVDKNTSLVTSISKEDGEPRPYLLSASILTVLEKPAPEESFRPGFADSLKNIKYNKGHIHFDRLPKADSVDNMPEIEELLSYVERPWIDHAGTAHQSQYMHPSLNLRNYGRDIAGVVSKIGLYLCIKHPKKHIEKLLINFLQVGIDLYSVANRGDGNIRWVGGGGQNSGRKWPILFAGLILNDSNMVKLDGISFQEDQQTYYGIGWTGDSVLWSPNHILRPDEDYEHKHPSKWTVDGRGEEGDPSSGSNSDARAEAYRICCTGITWPGIAISAYLMNAVDAWNHQPFFDYCVRWMKEDHDSLAVIIEEHMGRKYTRGRTDPFVAEMWQRNRW